jgi:predicted membrane protein
MEINTVFGSGEIIIPKDVPVRIKADAAFAGTTLPNNNTSAFGSIYYESPGFNASKPFLYINISVVFGSLHIRAL